MWGGLIHALKHLSLALTVHPLFEYDLYGKSYDQNMTILDPKFRLNHDWYVKIKKIDMTIHMKN